MKLNVTEKIIALGLQEVTTQLIIVQPELMGTVDAIRAVNLTAGKTPGVFAQVKAAITGAWHDAGEATKRFSENLKDAAAKAVGSLISGGQSIGATMKSFASSAYDSAAGAAAAFAGLPPQLGIVLAQPLKKVFGKIGSFIGGIFGGGKKAAEKMAEAARKAAEAGFHPSGGHTTLTTASVRYHRLASWEPVASRISA